MITRPSQELLPPPEGGRVYELAMRAGLGDCSPAGRMRLDAIARWLQDVAYADVEDAGLADAAIWVLRKSRIRVDRFPRFGERAAVRTFCSGIGRMWAERRTSIVRNGEAEADVEAVSLWVHLDPISRVPSRLTAAEIAAYGGTGAERRVTARLRHPTGLDGARVASHWTFRATERDLAEHVNNAAYWGPLEEELLADSEPGRLDVEMEFRTPAQPGEKRILTAGSRRWITDPAGEIHASLVIHTRAPAVG